VEVLDSEASVRCLLPPGEGRDVMVTVSNGRYPGLQDAVPFLSYQVRTYMLETVSDVVVV
jgi:hypothetical protein